MVFKPLAKYKDFALVPAHQSGGEKKGKWVLEEASKLRCGTFHFTGAKVNDPWSCLQRGQHSASTKLKFRRGSFKEQLTKRRCVVVVVVGSGAAAQPVSSHCSTGHSALTSNPQPFLCHSAGGSAQCECSRAHNGENEGKNKQ